MLILCQKAVMNHVIQWNGSFFFCCIDRVEGLRDGWSLQCPDLFVCAFLVTGWGKSFHSVCCIADSPLLLLSKSWKCVKGLHCHEMTREQWLATEEPAFHTIFCSRDVSVLCCYLMSQLNCLITGEISAPAQGRADLGHECEWPCWWVCDRMVKWTE